MSDTIDRYDLHQDGDCDCALVGHPQGDWVRYESHDLHTAALLARAESAEAELRAARSALANIKAGMVGSIAEGIADVGMELARCREELAELRGPKVLNVT